MRMKLPQGLLHTFFFVRWNSQNTVAIKSAFSSQASVAAGVAFHTHQVVATFHTKKARNESQNILPRSPSAMKPSSSNKGTKAMKTKGAMPQIGQAAVSKPPLKIAKIILRVRGPCACRRVAVPLLFVFFFIVFQKIGQRYDFLSVMFVQSLFFSKTSFYIKKSTIFAQNFTK